MIVRRAVRPLRWLVRAAAVVVLAVVVYLVVTLGQVWHASALNQVRPVQAIVVLGAAQYNHSPSPDLKARLDHADTLWSQHLATTLVVTGGREPGDPFTEAGAGADYLAAKGVPQADILREVSGRDSWQSLAASATFLKHRHIVSVLLVSDPFHDERISLMADELGLTPYVSPTRTSPIKGNAVIPYFVKETGEVAVGRIVGFRRLVGVGEQVQRATRAR
ncbi:MAG: YdcF family protein [Actinomycetota bacterium]|nr:YdcF family protein [Actinomycetota bacterium]